MLEAALAGSALVLADLESLRELWDRCALFVDPADPAAVETAVTGLITDPGRRAVLATRANLRGRELSPERMARGYHRLYRIAVELEAGTPAAT